MRAVCMDVEQVMDIKLVLVLNVHHTPFDPYV